MTWRSKFYQPWQSPLFLDEESHHGELGRLQQHDWDAWEGGQSADMPLGVNNGTLSSHTTFNNLSGRGVGPGMTPPPAAPSLPVSARPKRIDPYEKCKSKFDKKGKLPTIPEKIKSNLGSLTRIEVAELEKELRKGKQTINDTNTFSHDGHKVHTNNLHPRFDPDFDIDIDGHENDVDDDDDDRFNLRRSNGGLPVSETHSADFDSIEAPPSYKPTTKIVGGKSKRKRNSHAGKNLRIRVGMIVALVLTGVLIFALATFFAVRTIASQGPAGGAAVHQRFLLTLEGATYTAPLADRSSVEFRQLQATFCNATREILNSSTVLQAASLGCHVMLFRSGSIVTDFRLLFSLSKVEQFESLNKWTSFKDIVRSVIVTGLRYPATSNVKDFVRDFRPSSDTLQDVSADEISTQQQSSSYSKGASTRSTPVPKVQKEQHALGAEMTSRTSKISKPEVTLFTTSEPFTGSSSRGLRGAESPATSASSGFKAQQTDNQLTRSDSPLLTTSSLQERSSLGATTNAASEISATKSPELSSASTRAMDRVTETTHVNDKSTPQQGITYTTHFTGSNNTTLTRT